MTIERPQTMHVPARDIPLPGSVSAEARAMLARESHGEMPPWPALDDHEQWRTRVRLLDEGAIAMMAAFSDGQSAGAGPSVDEQILNGVATYYARPDDAREDDPRAVMNIHGGAWVLGAGARCRNETVGRVARFDAPTWSVDYRMPPDHPFPAALDDGVAVYRALLEDRGPQSIIVAGDSAGGNIAAGLMFRIRDEGLPLPAGLVLDTPATDLTASGDTLWTNVGIDTILTGDLLPTMAIYAGGADRRHPQLSPLYGDFATGYPSTLLLTGTRDRLLSDTVRFHRALLAARIPVALHVFEAQGHGGFMGTAPEDRERAEVVREFIAATFNR